MRDPKPINLTSDDYWRGLGWPAIARDADGHAMSVCDDRYPESFAEWLKECEAEGHTVTNLKQASVTASPE